MDPQKRLSQLIEEYSVRRKVKVTTEKNVDQDFIKFGDLWLDTDSNTLFMCQGKINGKYRWSKIDNTYSQEVLNILNRANDET